MSTFMSLAAAVYAEYGDDDAGVEQLCQRITSAKLQQQAITFACYEALTAERRAERAEIIAACPKQRSALQWPLGGRGKARRRAALAASITTEPGESGHGK